MAGRCLERHLHEPDVVTRRHRPLDAPPEGPAVPVSGDGVGRRLDCGLRAPAGPHPQGQPAGDGLDDAQLAEVVGVVDLVIRAEGERVLDVATGGRADGGHRGRVDDEVVVSLEESVDETFAEPHDELLGELRRPMAPVAQADVEVGRHDVPARARTGLAGLLPVELRHEGSAGDHRGEAGHVVALRRVGHEVLHERPDPPHDASDHGGNRRPARDDREAGGTHGDEVGVEVDQVVPTSRVGQVGATVGRCNEDDLVDDCGPVRLRQHGFRKGPGHEAAPAVGDDVDRQVGAGVVTPQLEQQVLGILSGIDAEGPVVVADDGVIGRQHRREEPLGARHESHRSEGAHGRGEGAVHEQEQAHRSAHRQRQGGADSQGLPGRRRRSGDVDESRSHRLLEPAHDPTDDERHGEAEHDRLHRAVHQRAEQPTVVGLLGGQSLRPTARSRRRCARSLRLDGDLEGQGAGLERPCPPGGAHGQVPRVDPVALEQHHRVVAGRDVDVDTDRAAAVGRPG